ncbi:MAG TPA: APC family permease [Methylomirabilota bacterium]|nr:APC family permease [Methylomirabilota bacterium]
MSSQKMFVRDATGLVRALGFADQFIISQAIINILGGFVLTALFAPFYFPGANLSVVFALGSIPALAMAYVYSKLSAAIPRSGGDYIWSTRILGPFFGSIQFIFLFVGTVIIGIGLSIWSAQAVALSQLAFAIGVTTNNVGIIKIGTALSQASLGYPVSVVMTVVVTAIALLSLRVYSWFQKISYFLYYIIAALFLFVLFTVDPSTIPGLFDHAMQVAGYNVTYTGMLQQAAAQGFSATDFNLTNSLLAAIPWGFLTFTGFNYGAYLAGETKNVKNSMTRALFLSVFVTIIALVVMGLLVYRDFGSGFLNAASYIAATNPGSLPALPTTTMLLSVASPFYASLLSLGLYLGWLVVSVAYVVTMSRMLFAAAFDRLLPVKFADVSDRFHSPGWATIFIGAIVFVYLTIYWNFGWAATWLNTSLVAPIGYLLPLVATLLFPFVKRDFFKRTVGTMGSGPAIAFASFVGVAAFAFYIVAESFPIAGSLGVVFLGANLGLAYGVVLGLILLGVLVYATGSARLKSLGIDIKALYAEIPPE